MGTLEKTFLRRRGLWLAVNEKDLTDHAGDGPSGRRSKGIKTGKLGMRLGNRYLSDLIGTMGGHEIGMELKRGGPHPQQIKPRFDVLYFKYLQEAAS